MSELMCCRKTSGELDTCGELEKTRHRESSQTVGLVMAGDGTLLAALIQVLFLASINGFSLIGRDSMTRTNGAAK